MVHVDYAVTIEKKRAAVHSHSALLSSPLCRRQAPNSAFLSRSELVYLKRQIMPVRPRPSRFRLSSSLRLGADFVECRTQCHAVATSLISALLFPKLSGNLDRVDAHLLPPGYFISRSMNRAMVLSAERDSVFVAHLTTESTRLHEAQMMGSDGLRGGQGRRA